MNTNYYNLDDDGKEQLLENYKTNGNATMCLNNFLHGSCDLFAYALSEKFGYDIECVKDRKDYLIHAYCVANIDGERVFIDARGINSNYNEFIDEFLDFIDIEDMNEIFYPNDITFKLNKENFLISDNQKDIINLATSFIEDNLDDYDINSLNKDMGIEY